VLIVDTGVLVAATDRNDPDHAACAALLENEAEPLVTTGLVLAETAYLLDRELGPQVEATLYESITDGQLTVEALTVEDWHRVHALVLRYADHRLGGTDASLVALAERHRQRRIATLNTRHFRAIRPVHIAAFTVLPADLP
jgi:predicted nucleic acid-binding protein